jgi:hypothetical protein
VGRGKSALDRVLRITPLGYNQSHAVARSSLALVREYLRRVAEWTKLSGQLERLIRFLVAAPIDVGQL